MATPEEKQRKRARNQALMREINENVVDATAEPSAAVDGRLAVFCECFDEDCLETLALTLEEYETIRAHAVRFPVKPGHVLPDIERVVETRERYAVVEKIGESGRVAAALAPGTRTNGAPRRGDGRGPQA